MGCAREMDLRFNKHLVPNTAKSPHYDKGTLMHHGQEIFYGMMGQGKDWSLRKAEAMKGMREYAPTLDLDTENILDVYRTFEEYAEYRKNDVLHVVFTERLFRVKAYEDSNLRLRIFLTGKIDLGIMEGTQLVPWDHKTESESWFYSQNNNQFKIYALVCNSPKIIINRIGFQKTVKPEKKFKREEIFFEPDVIEEFTQEVLPYYAKQMLIAAEDNYYPPNYSNCIKGHFACIFSDKYNGGVCNIDRKLRPAKLKMHFIEREWNINEP
jgi:hypothetical protein